MIELKNPACRGAFQLDTRLAGLSDDRASGLGLWGDSPASTAPHLDDVEHATCEESHSHSAEDSAEDGKGHGTNGRECSDKSKHDAENDQNDGDASGDECSKCLCTV